MSGRIGVSPLLEEELSLAVLPLSAAIFGKFTYTDNGTSIIITDYPDAARGALAISATIAGKPVTSIGPRAFDDCYNLTSVTIPNSVTTIWHDAFRDCSSLTSVTIPSSVTDISERAFAGCRRLTSVTIPSSVTYIGVKAFYGCGSLTTASFLGNAPLMSGGAFDNAAAGFTVYYFLGKTGFNSSYWVSYLRVGLTAAPEIDVEQQTGSPLVDRTTKMRFGTMVVGQSGRVKKFTIKNTGLVNLTGLAVTVDGTNAEDFIISPFTKTKLVPGASTTLKITFKPSAAGTRSAAIHIQSNDADENPFDINLSGLGVVP